MFEQFTDRARRVMVLAQEEARLLQHNFIGTEHLLLGLIHEGEGVGAKTLESLGITLEPVRAAVTRTIGAAGMSTTGSPPFTPRAKRVLELSLREALDLKHHYIGTEHLLLGILSEGEGVGAQVLVQLGAELPDVRARVLEVLSGAGPMPSLERVATSQGESAASVARPLCPQCGAGLVQHAFHKRLEVTDADNANPVAFLVVYCRLCGKALAFKPEA